MRRIASLLAALGLLATSAPSAAASDVTSVSQSVNQGTTQITTITESNRPVHLAQINARYRSRLGPDSPYTTRLENGTRAEFWKLQATVNQCLDVTMRSDELDSLVGVYQIKGSTGDAFKMAEDDDSGGGRHGRDANLRHVLPASGTYYVVATSASGSEAGRYSLEIASCAGSNVGSSSSTSWPSQPGYNPFRPRSGSNPWLPTTGTSSYPFAPATVAPSPASTPSTQPAPRPGSSVPLPRF